MPESLKEDGLGPSGDEFYNLLLELHTGLDEAESHALNARLVLLMANEIGDIERLKAVFEAAAKYR
ncbi:MAG: DUF2783 domain-containing protein [Pseudomonadota bacterium]